MKNRSGKQAWIGVATALCMLLASCGGTGDGAPVNDCEHKLKRTNQISAPTCTETGSEEIVCRDCETVLERITKPAVGHRYSVDEGKSVKGSCTTDGLTVETCWKCGFERQETVVAAGHSYTARDTGYTHLKGTTAEEAEYYISCEHCEENGAETFTRPLVDKSLYTFECPVLTLYDTRDTLSYGFTWNCEAQPLSPVLSLKKKGDTAPTYYGASVENIPRKRATITFARRW